MPTVKNKKAEEDRIWDTIARKRDIKNARYLSHKKAWKYKGLLSNSLEIRNL